MHSTAAGLQYSQFPLRTSGRGPADAQTPHDVHPPYPAW
jgi:hypothetical protein